MSDVDAKDLRPNVMDRLGFGNAELSKIDLKLVYGAISGFGHDDVLPSPYGELSAAEIVRQPMAGLRPACMRSLCLPAHTKDGYLVMAVVGEHIWKRFANAIGIPHLVDDPRFSDGAARQMMMTLDDPVWGRSVLRASRSRCPMFPSGTRICLAGWRSTIPTCFTSGWA